MKRMKSNLHGFCHAYNANEEAYLRKLGWIEESESFDAAPTEEAPAEKPKAPAMQVRRSRKPKD